MRFSSFVVGLLSLSTSVFSYAIPSASDVTENVSPLEKRAFTPVTGASGAVRVRLEIRQMQKKSAQWTIFLLAMQKYMQQPQSAKLSYYQIAGIHGVPRVSWDDVGKCSACTGQVDGYCTHSSILFLGWHRAYLALFEQELIKYAKQIASQFTGSDKTTYTNAANLMRLPFWDWAAHAPNNGNVMPQSLTAPYVTLDTPTGRKTIQNPMAKYHFDDTSGLVYGAYKTFKNTLRYPQSAAANAASQQNKAVAAFNNIRATMQDRLYQLFSTCDEFVEVGSDQKGTSSSKCSNSLEGLHNTIHQTAGGPKTNGIPAGHMYILSTAAFDPIFWVHHANVDRLFAMWQALYPNSYGGSQVAPHSTWTIAKGTTQNANSPLTPFHRDSAGNFWTTNLVRDHTKFKYTYPEFHTTDGSKSAISKIVNKLYGPNASGVAGTTKRDVDAEAYAANTTASATSATSSASAAPVSTDATPLIANNGSLFQYVANVQYPRYALESSYDIFLFNNDPTSEDPANFLLDPNLIGPISALSDTNMNGDMLSVSSVPLTRTLSQMVDGGILPSLTELLAVPYLKKSLKWRIVGSDGTIVDPDNLPGFEVSVYASTSTVASEFDLPVWSEFIPLAEITENKAGGATLTSILNATESLIPSVYGGN